LLPSLLREKDRMRGLNQEVEMHFPLTLSLSLRERE
jgi:hypothetical protein